MAIASKGRPHVLGETLGALKGQTRRPDAIWIAVPSRDDVPADLDPSTVRVLHPPVGLTIQRNALLEAVGDDVDVIVFLDDDTELHPSFLARAAAFANAHPDVILFGGLVIEDGVRVGEIDRPQARARLLNRQPGDGYRKVSHVYGCCMAVRAGVARKVRFDESLRLYGWLEDRDFGLRMSREGPVLLYEGCELVHLGVSSGRQSGIRLGFQQVVHPLYLRRKRVLTRTETVLLLGRPVLANLIGAVSRRRGRSDRTGRLRGNVIGLGRVVFGNGDPNDVIDLP